MSQPETDTKKNSRATIWFSEQPGFGIRKYGSGRGVYVVQCPTPAGRRTITIGNSAVVSYREALDVARRCIYYADEERNLADERKRVRRTPLFADYLDLYWQVMRPQWKPSSQISEDKYRRLYLDNAFVGMGLDEITTQDVVRWMSTATRERSPGGANKALQRLKAVMFKAEEWGYRPHGSNPCRGVKPNPRRKVGRYLSETEFARLARTMETHKEAFPAQTQALQLLILTGCRKQEIVGLTWGEVKGSRIYLKDSKTGARTVHLCSQAADILSNRKRGTPLAPVFSRAPGQVISIDAYWHKIRQEAALGRFRLHDLRHTYASLAARNTLPLPTIQRLLGHSHMASTARYTHFDDRHLISIAQKISDLIEGAASP